MALNSQIETGFCKRIASIVIHSSSAPSALSPCSRLAQIERARRTALQEQAALPSGWLAPWIERSWQRCMGLGLRAHQPVAFELVSAQHRRRTLEASQQLRQTALPILQKLGRALVDTRYFAILTNAEGVVVDVNGPIDRSDPRAQAITRIGTDLSERSVGTTAIGSALTELQPVWLHRGEHFFCATSDYSCAGAPLFGPDGACIGMLDVTGIDAVERPELKHLVIQAGGQIENALLRRQAHRLLLRLNWPGTSLGSDADGLVCLDTDGWITGANPVARQMLPMLAAPGQPNVHVSEVFGLPYEQFFDTVGHPDATLEIPLWTGLRLQVLPVERSCEELPVACGQRLAGGNSLRLREIESALIRQAVTQARGNVAMAARALGISRATVYRKLVNPK